MVRTATTGSARKNGSSVVRPFQRAFSAVSSRENPSITLTAPLSWPVIVSTQATCLLNSAVNTTLPPAAKSAVGWLAASGVTRLKGPKRSTRFGPSGSTPWSHPLAATPSSRTARRPRAEEEKLGIG